MSSKKINKISFCISTNATKVDKTRVLISSIFNIKPCSGVKIDITLCGCVQEFRQIPGLKLINECKKANEGMLSYLRFIAAKDAVTDVFVFVDDDFLFPEDWLIKFVQFSEKENWDILAHRILLPNGSRFWDKATYLPHQMIHCDAPYGDYWYQTGGLWIIKSSSYKKCQWNPSIPIYAEDKGFPWNEDVDMSIRAKELGLKIFFDKNNLAWHNDKSYYKYSIFQTKNHLGMINESTEDFLRTMKNNDS